MSTFMFNYLNHDLRLLKFNKPLHFFAEMPLQCTLMVLMGY